MAAPDWHEIDWREHLRWVEVDGARANVCDVGSGPPLLLVHGHSGSWANWLLNIPHLAASRRVIAPDLPGFGASEMSRGRISIESYGSFLGRLLDALEVEGPLPVVGNSLGGFVSAELTVKDPERVEGLVLVSAAGLSAKYVGLSEDLLRRGWFRALARAVNAYATIPDARAETLVRRPRLRQAVLWNIVRDPRGLDPAIAAEMLRGAGRPAAPFAMDALVDYDFREHVRSIRCPTLIVWGDTDRVVTVEAGDRYAEALPHARKVVLERTGHVPMIERPERFNELVDEFLAELDGAREEPVGEPVAEPVQPS